MSTESTIKKSLTTVRLDPSLKESVMRFAKKRHISFSTFLTISLQNSLKHGIHFEETEDPRDFMSEKQIQELIALEKRIDSGEEKMYGPFEGKAAIDFLKQLS